MKLQYGLLALLFAIAIPAHAEQTSSDSNDSPAPTPQPASTEQAQQQMTEQAGFSIGSVVRSTITTAVENREPTDSLESASTEQNQLYFFTELRDMSGQTARHRWEHNGKVMAEVEFDVKGPRWRVWSSKSFVPNWTGDWKVSVVNGAGDVISEKRFVYETAAATNSADMVTPAATESKPQ